VYSREISSLQSRIFAKTLEEADAISTTSENAV
jgi:hypothetical protein